MTCLTCQDKYYIFTFDTKSNEDAIQKCDDCNVFKTDKQALLYFCLKTYNRHSRKHKAT